MSRPLSVGDEVRDNDPRMVGRVLTVVEITDNGIVAIDTARRKFRILRRRVYTDGRIRRGGFSRIPLGDA